MRGIILVPPPVIHGPGGRALPELGGAQGDGEKAEAFRGAFLVAMATPRQCGGDTGLHPTDPDHTSVRHVPFFTQT